jgi:hypothetical protein
MLVGIELRRFSVVNFVIGLKYLGNRNLDFEL